ncbi:MAG: hypothetical protein ACRD15_17700, partial [Vicinamibacterales bacterium]
MAKRIILSEVPDDRGRSGDGRTHAAGRPPATPDRPVDDILAEIRQLYFKTKPGTIERDFDRAIDLLKTIPTPAERQRATVY